MAAGKETLGNLFCDQVSTEEKAALLASFEAEKSPVFIKVLAYLAHVTVQAMIRRRIVGELSGSR